MGRPLAEVSEAVAGSSFPSEEGWGTARLAIEGICVAFEFGSSSEIRTLEAVFDILEELAATS